VKEAAGAARPIGASQDDPLRELAWLAGAWQGENGGERIEETWLPPEGASMVGVGRSIEGASMTFYELLRIEVRDGVAVYVAAPRGGPPTEFKATSAGKTEAVFENLAHDWPKRITYRLEASALHVRVEGAPGERVDDFTLARAVVTH
jgi:hypothetical protein